MIGSVVSHYRVVDRLGAGGMGVVYRAEDLRLGRHVALKFLPESATADPLATERFQREARTTSALNHPNICTLHDIGEIEGRRFIVMELIDGATLDKVLGAGALPVDRVIDISINVADALDAAHSEGILHRDIKPGNIFITKRGQVKVVDFGLAKMMSHRNGLTPLDLTMAEQHQLTSAGMAVGTVAYMSPEHARGEHIDQRSDLFSLGVVMYEMATGVQTFKGQTTAVIFDQILNRVPVPPSTINPDVIPSLEHIIGRLLEKDRERRYQSARDVQADLQRLKRDLDARRVVTADAAQTSPPTTWTPFENVRSASTVAVNVPTFGVDADPSPVPAAWATDWDQPRPASKPSVDRASGGGSFNHPGADRPADRPAAAASAPLPGRGGSATATMSGEVSTSAPTVMVPVSGASPAAPPAPPPLPPPPPEASPLPAFDAVMAYVPNAPDADTALASERREAAERAGTPHTEREPAAVPAVWTSSPPRTPGTAASSRTLVVGGALAATLVLAGGSIWWMLRDGNAPAAPTESTATTPEAPPPTTPATDQPAAPVDPPATAATTPSAPAPGTPTTARPTTPAGATTARSTPAPGAPAATPGSGANPAPPRPTSQALLAQAATMLSEAKGLLQTGAEAEGLARISALRASFAGTPPAREGAVLAARTHHQARRFDDATAAWIDAAREGVGAEEISEGLIQVADGAARLRTADSDTSARRTLGELLDRYPSSVRALRALQMKMSLEDRMKLKEPDAELNGVAPTSLLTLRKTARGAGTAPVAEFALWRLGQEYRDRRLYALAAATFADLGTRFPTTRYEAWFAAGELFEKQLKDPARARDAYAKVPAGSSRYEAAQKKLASGQA